MGVRTRPVVAFQLSLLGDRPKPCGAWMPKLCLWSFFGVLIPPDDDEIRQFKMLYPNAKQFDFGTQRESPSVNALSSPSVLEGETEP